MVRVTAKKRQKQNNKEMGKVFQLPLKEVLLKYRQWCVVAGRTPQKINEPKNSKPVEEVIKCNNYIPR